MNARSCACMLGCNGSGTMSLTSAAVNITGPHRESPPVHSGNRLNFVSVGSTERVPSYPVDSLSISILLIVNNE